ncbi:acetate--CoA ligase family protein [Streptomyces mirabilis]|uniref:acetate--CoA ligase family protein n=1 Tax=Streptomyces mirabilis TaxID=68239 RepID=UPI003813AE0D
MRPARPLARAAHRPPPALHTGGELLLAGRVHRLSWMASDLPQLTDADLNPVLAGPHGVTTLDARVRLVPRHAHDPYLRRLR